MYACVTDCIWYVFQFLGYFLFLLADRNSDVVSGGDRIICYVSRCHVGYVCICTGQVNAFGVFQSYYAANQLKESSASDISWIGGVQIALLYISGLILGRVFDKYGARVSEYKYMIPKTQHSPNICRSLLCFCSSHHFSLGE